MSKRTTRLYGLTTPILDFDDAFEYLEGNGIDNAQFNFSGEVQDAAGFDGPGAEFYIGNDRVGVITLRIFLDIMEHYYPEVVHK